ncbi:MAG: hypothetical protein JWQ30_2260 [Sediminibacterium sp.]|nr:hypothetical protein [Sediminibacterium sp.]
MILAAFVLSSTVHAQVKEGHVTYKVELKGGPDGNDMGSIFGDTYMTIYFKNDKSLTEMVTPVYSMKTLTDSKGTLTLMDGGGQKSFSRKPKEETEKDKSKGGGPNVVITKEKKKLMGYDCTKALITMKYNNSKQSTSTITIWFTEKIQCVAAAGILNPEVFAKIKGMPLEVEMDGGMVRSKMTATEISVKPVPDAVFALSTGGYTEKKIPLPGKH